MVDRTKKEIVYDALKAGLYVFAIISGFVLALTPLFAWVETDNWHWIFLYFLAAPISGGLLWGIIPD